MAPDALRILVAEKQALISLEIELLLTELTGSSVTVCAERDMERELDSAHFDIVLLAAAASAASNRSRYTLLRQKGLGIVFLTSFEDVPGLTGHEDDVAILPKPFHEQSLLSAVRTAAGRLSLRTID
ncbi:hypothetical protein [Rhizobium paknamense]|uniref:DNA-binding response OmpR family regulator n=1 Tax=Rhizobium paknamense TaxID=1206817 RepID=A0ABU0IFT1_9HYPH|nr:hypothetical protein [Rhizobium paknamense]MDQ0456290.1 DNA-binding response OmpR family regulator [Rhizobium paknamense]